MGGNSAQITNAEQKAESIRFQSSMFGGVVPILHGTNRVPPNLLEYGDFKATENRSTQSSGGKGGGGVETTNIWYTYTASVLMGLVEGPITGTGRKWQGKRVFESGETFPSAEGGAMFGLLGQAPWSVLSTMHGGTHELGYSGLALYRVQDYYLGTEATVLNHGIEVYGPGKGFIHSSVWDCLPDGIISDWVSSTRRGLGITGVLADLTNYANYCKASGFWFSPLLLEQAPAADRFEMMQRVSNSVMVEMDGQIHMVPLGAEAVSSTVGGGIFGTPATYTWTPDLTPIYELTPDQLMPRGDDQPLVGIERMTPADAYNIVEIEYSDRAADYSPAIARKVDQASIDLYGERPAPKLVCPWITTAFVADRVAQIELNRHMQLMNTYTFDLPWNFADVIPTSLLTLTSPDQALEALPVRVRKRDERDNGFTVVAQDFPTSLSAQPLHVLPVADGYKNDYGALPGATTVHAIFEAPRELADGDLELWIAAGSTSDSWGGCNVWVSADGLEYKQLTTILGKSRVGTLPEAVLSSASSIKVSGVNGQLLSGSALDATLGATLCYIGGSEPEYFAYTSATLTSAGAYTLGSVVRGIYGSTAKPHLTSEPFVRCDDTLGRSGPMSLQMVGRTVYIKCQSFNVFGLATQDLADVSAVSYAVTGRFALMPDDQVNLITQGDFDPLPLAERPSAWAGGTVVSVSGQPFTRALQTSLLDTEVLVRVSAKEGDKFWLTGRLNGVSSTTTTALGVKWYDASGAFLSFTGAGVTVAAAGAWTSVFGLVTAPAGAAYGVPVVRRGSAGAGTSMAARLTMVKQLTTNELVDNAATQILQSYLASGVTDDLTVTPTLNPVVQAGWDIVVHLSFTWDAVNTSGSTKVVRGKVTPNCWMTDGTLSVIGDSTYAYFTASVPNGGSASGFFAKSYQYKIDSGTDLMFFARLSQLEVFSAPFTLVATARDLKCVVEVIKK